MSESLEPREVILRAESLVREVTAAAVKKTIIDQFSFEFQRGGIYTIIGPSGAGKSSLLRLFNRLDPATSGRVMFEGIDTMTIPPATLRCRIGYLFQTPFLFKGTVAENIRYARANLTDDQVHDLAEAARLTPEQVHARVDNLSGGEAQRVALARLLATNPAIALLDEPTSSLDPGRTEAIEKLVKALVDERGLTVIMVSHDLQQALRMGGITLLMASGRLVESGPAEQTLNRPQTELGRRYQSGELT
jgi:putative ABC transport system ATP-binding protein